MSVTNLLLDDGSSLLSTLIVITIAAFALIFLKGFFAPPEARPNRNRNPPANNTNNNRNTAAAAGQQQQQPTTATPQPPSTSAAPAQRGLAIERIAVRSITISAPGVLLEETDPASFSEGATVLPSAIAALQTALKKDGAAGGGGSIYSSLLANTNVYILCQVADDIGEAAVRAALEFSGLMGSNQGQIPSQRFLFCETQVGKMSLVRQIEPEVHIDGDGSTVDQLTRFIPRLIQVRNPQNEFDSNNGSTRIENSGKTVVVGAEDLDEALGRIFFLNKKI